MTGITYTKDQLGPSLVHYNNGHSNREKDRSEQTLLSLDEDVEMNKRRGKTRFDQGIPTGRTLRTYTVDTKNVLDGKDNDITFLTYILDVAVTCLPSPFSTVSSIMPDLLQSTPLLFNRRLFSRFLHFCFQRRPHCSPSISR